MKRWTRCLGLGLCLWLAVCVPSEAESVFVSDDLKLPVRTGKGLDFKIIAILSSGDSAEVLSAEGDWSQVRLPNGKEGWVQSRFLVSAPPAVVRVERLEKRNQALTAQLAELTEEAKKLKKDNGLLQTELAKNQKSLNEVSQSFQTLRTESADFVKLKTDHEETAAELANVSKQAAALQAEVARLERRSTLWWFLAGAGVFLLGFLIGFSAKRQRRKSSLY